MSVVVALFVDRQQESLHHSLGRVGSSCCTGRTALTIAAATTASTRMPPTTSPRRAPPVLTGVVWFISFSVSKKLVYRAIREDPGFPPDPHPSVKLITVCARLWRLRSPPGRYHRSMALRMESTRIATSLVSISDRNEPSQPRFETRGGIPPRTDPARRGPCLGARDPGR